MTNKRFDFKSNHHITKPNRIRKFGESSGGWWSSMIHQIGAIFGAWLNDHFGWVFVGMPQAFNLGSSIESLLISQNECYSSRKHVGFSFEHFESWESLLFHGALHSFWGGNCEVSLHWLRWQVFIEVKKMLGRIRAEKLAPDSSSIARPIFVSWCHKKDVLFLLAEMGGPLIRWIMTGKKTYLDKAFQDNLTKFTSGRIPGDFKGIVKNSVFKSC